MQAFTKIEIKWVIDELEAEMKQLKSLSAVETGPHVPCISCGPNNWTLSLASYVRLSKPETSALRSSIQGEDYEIFNLYAHRQGWYPR